MFDWGKRKKGTEAVQLLLAGLIEKIGGLHQAVQDVREDIRNLERRQDSSGTVYRDCMNRVTEVALGMSGHTELAERFRAHSGVTERIEAQGTTVEPMTWEDKDGEPWPPKGHVALDSRG